MNKNNLIFAKRLANLLDNKFSFLGIRFGLDPILDLIPGAGDVIGLLLGLYIIWVGYQYKLPKDRIFVMFRNVVIDFIIGLVPVVGVIGTVFYRSNQMNIRVIESYLDNDNVEDGEIIG
jgi:hypothetical protein